ncbi:MAG: hypothetical protein ACREHD_04100, partial [Pirellulales bacterium]
NEDLFRRLARLPRLRFLEFNPGTHSRPPVFTPLMAAALGNMRQLRISNVDCTVYRELIWNEDGTSYWGKGNWGDVQKATHECLLAVGKLTQLERLRICMWLESSDNLAHLDDLTRLKSLRLDMPPFGAIEQHSEEHRIAEPHILACLPGLPLVEELDLHGAEISDSDLERLSALPRLKTLSLAQTFVSDGGLATLALLKSLEELAIDERIATAAAFEALGAIEHLRAVHINLTHTVDDDAKYSVALTPDDDYELAVAPDEVDRLRRAIETLRQCHPRMTIDTRYSDFERKLDPKPPWQNGDGMPSFLRR